MTLTIFRRPWPVVLKPGVLALYAALALGGGTLIAARRLQLTGHLSLTWQEAALTGALALAGLVIHETGHAAAARATGRTVERLEFGLAGGAVTSGDTTPWRRVAAIVAGPLVEIAFGSLLWSAGGGSWDNPAGAAGFLSLVNGVGNLMPVHKSLDGYRLLLFSRLALRGNEPLACTRAGSCPACTGAAIDPDRSEELVPLTA
jgi:Zn-dependent protease